MNSVSKNNLENMVKVSFAGEDIKNLTIGQLKERVYALAGVLCPSMTMGEVNSVLRNLEIWVSDHSY